MVISTAIMIGGAIAGGIGGGLANKKRKEEQQDELDILALKNRQNYKEQQAAVVGLKSSMENQALQATKGARQDAVEAFRATSAAEAAAGASGVKGGTPFYKMGQIAAEASMAMRENAALRANQISATKDAGAAEIAGVLTNGAIIDKQIGSATKSMNYLSSPLAWGQAILTGAISGAEAGAKISMGLESIGVDTGYDLNDLFKAADSPAEAASKAIGASGMGAAGVTDDMMGGAKSTIDAVASGNGNLNDYIAKYRLNATPSQTGVDLNTYSPSGALGLGGKKKTLGDTWLMGDYEGLNLLKKNQVPDAFNAFSGIQF